MQVQKSCGLPEEEADLHTAVLPSRCVCMRELISLQPRCNKHFMCWSSVVVCQEGKDGSGHDRILCRRSLKIEGGVPISFEI